MTAAERRKRELLKSALLVFSTKGYGGARSDQIVGRMNSYKRCITIISAARRGCT